MPKFLAKTAKATAKTTASKTTLTESALRQAFDDEASSSASTTSASSASSVTPSANVASSPFDPAVKGLEERLRKMEAWQAAVTPTDPAKATAGKAAVRGGTGHVK